MVSSTATIDQLQIKATWNYREDLNYCRSILPGVSRTFAISINHLKGDLHISVLVGYLLCRIADTIEDSPKVKLNAKKDLFDTFRKSLDDPGYIDEFEKKSLVLKGNEKHLDLNQNAGRAIAIFHRLPPAPKAVVKKWVFEMIKGMKDFVIKYPDGVRIQSLEEYKRYCFYVAGTVGNMLTGLWKIYGSPMKKEQEKILNRYSASFGEGLQTVNILKDISEDALEENNFYIPESLLKKIGSSHSMITREGFIDRNYQAIQEIIDVARKNMQNAFIYYSSLPKRDFRIRLFCLLPMLFAFATIRKLKRTRDMLIQGKSVKIPRWEVKVLIFLAPFIILIPFSTKWLIQYLSGEKRLNFFC